MFKCCCLQWSVHLATPSLLTGMSVELKETNVSTKHNRLEHPYWKQIVIYKHDGAFELGYTRNFGFVVRVGLEPATFRFQVRDPNHSATLSPQCLVRWTQYKASQDAALVVYSFNTLHILVSCSLLTGNLDKRSRDQYLICNQRSLREQILFDKAMEVRRHQNFWTVVPLSKPVTDCSSQ